MYCQIGCNENHSMSAGASAIFSQKKGEDIPHLIIIWGERILNW